MVKKPTSYTALQAAIAGSGQRADSIKSRESNAKRTATGLRTLLADVGKDLSVTDRKSLEDAITTIGTIISAYETGARAKRHSEKKQETRMREAKAITLRVFAPLTSVEDKVALIASIHPWLLSSSDLDRYKDRHGRVHAESTIKHHYGDALDSIAYNISAEGLDMDQQALAIFERFKQARPAHLLKYADHIELIKQALEPSV